VKQDVANRFVGFAIGALTFAMSHALEVAMWSEWFGGVNEPWFLNNGPAAAFTLGCVLIASGGLALLNPSGRPVRGVTLALGAFAAMTVALFLKAGGPGTIFPIVLAVGGVFLLISSTLGAWIGREIRGAVKGR
jgi:hypothetical protein